MGSNKIKKLTELSQLYKDGILTKEEFESEKKKLLANDPTKTLSNQEKDFSEISERVQSQKNRLKYNGSPSFKETSKQKWASFSSMCRKSNFIVWLKTNKKPLSITLISLAVVCLSVVTIFIIHDRFSDNYSWEDETLEHNAHSESDMIEEVDLVEDILKEAMISKSSVNVRNPIFRDLIVENYSHNFFEKLQSKFPYFGNVVQKDNKLWAESGNCIGENGKVDYAWICYDPVNKTIQTSQIVNGIRLSSTGGELPRNIEGWDAVDFKDEICRHYVLFSENDHKIKIFEIFIGAEFETLYTDLLNIKNYNLKKLSVKDKIFNREFRIGLTKEYVVTYEDETERWALDPAYAHVADTDWGKLAGLAISLPNYSIILEDGQGNIKEFDNPKNLSHYYDAVNRWFFD